MSRQETGNDARLPARLEDLLRSIPLVFLGLATALVAAAKQGVMWPQVVVWENNRGLLPETSAESLSYGYRIVGYALGFDQDRDYLLLSAAVSLGAVVAICLAVMRHIGSGSPARLAVMVLLSGPIIWSLSANLGRTDALLIVGSALLIMQKRAGIPAALAALVMLLAHPEQAVVSCLALVLLSFGARFYFIRGVALTGLMTSLAGFTILAIWAAALGVTDRSRQFLDLLGASLGRFLTYLPLELYAALGGTVFIMVICLFWDPAPSNRWSVFVAGLALPLLVTAVTLDQSRVFVGVSSAVVIIIVVSYSGEILDLVRRVTRSPLFLTFLVLAVLPAIHISFTGELVAPWRELYYAIIYR